MKNVFVLLKMVDVDNNKLMGLLIIDGRSSFLSQKCKRENKENGCIFG